jgi:hypothetical protein
MNLVGLDEPPRVDLPYVATIAVHRRCTGTSSIQYSIVQLYLVGSLHLISEGVPRSGRCTLNYSMVMGRIRICYHEENIGSGSEK